MDINIGISILSFLIAGASLVLSIFALWIDNPKISVKAQLGYSMPENQQGERLLFSLAMVRKNPENIGLENHTIPKIIFLIVNSGKRPIVVHEFILKFSDKEDVVIWPLVNLKKLDSYEVYSDITNLNIIEIIDKFGMPKGLAVSDSTGKQWKVENNSWKKILVQLDEARGGQWY